MMDVIQPLNELGDREVKKPEIMKIYEQLKVIDQDVKELDKDTNVTA